MKKLASFLILMIFFVTFADAQSDGLYAGQGPDIQEYGFINKTNAKLKNPNFLTLMNCDYSSGRREVIALETNDLDSLKRVRIKPNGTFRKAFEWLASDGTRKVSVMKGRRTGDISLRIRINAHAEYQDPNPDVNMICYGTATYRMNKVATTQAQSY